MNIDYTKLNERIVAQAVESARHVLTAEQRETLFQNKIDRARAMIESRDTVYTQTDR